MKYFLVSFLFLILTIPLLFLKFIYLRDNYFYELFLGNYIFYIHYLVIFTFILMIVNRFIIDIPKNIYFLLIIVSLGIVGYMGSKNFYNSKIIENNIVINKESKLKNLKIIFISDLHLTLTSNKEMFKKSFDKINDLNGDIIILGGDILDYSYTQVRDNYQDIFKNLKSKYGVYGVLGNHEYYGGVQGNEEYIKSLGIKVLRDDTLLIEDVKIIGRDDYHNKNRKPLNELIEVENKSNPIIIIDHNPEKIDEAIDAKGDLQLSGHTHKGQFFPYNLVVDYKFKNGYGYKKFNNLHTIVTAGLGSWQIPYRIGSTSEINVVNLEFSKGDK